MSFNMWFKVDRRKNHNNPYLLGITESIANYLFYNKT